MILLDKQNPLGKMCQAQEPHDASKAVSQTFTIRHARLEPCKDDVASCPMLFYVLTEHMPPNTEPTTRSASGT
jgi:hypothetical protein